MEPEAALSETVGAIYEASLDPTLWPIALEQLRLYCNAWVAHLHIWNKCSGTVPFSLLVGDVDPEAEAPYVAYYGSIDPRVQKLETIKPGELLVCHRHFDDRYVARSEFYQDYYLPKARGRYVAGTKLVDDGELQAIIGLHRNASLGLFTESDEARIRLILPHMARATRIQHRMERVHTKEKLITSALDKLPFGVVLVDSKNATIVLANATAEQLLRRSDGICCAKGRLCARLRDDEHELQSAIALADGFVTIRRDAGRPLFIKVAPLSAHAAGRFGWARPAALLLIRDLDAVPEPPQHAIARAFGLTRSEARVAALVGSGIGPCEAAEKLGITTETARTMLKRVFSKVGVSRQSELAALLARLALR